MKKIQVALIKIIAVVMISLLLPLLTKGDTSVNVVYAMEEEQELHEETEVQETDENMPETIEETADATESGVELEELNLDGGLYRLYSDETVSSVNVSWGEIDLNGYTLTVNSDFVMSEGELYNSNHYAGGGVSCGGNFLIEESEIKRLSVELAGSMVVTGSAISIDTLVLNGEGAQTIKTGDNAEIEKLELINYSDEGVHFVSRMNCYEFITNGCRFTHEEDGQYGYTLQEDVIFEGDYHLVAGKLDLNGHSMTVRGDFYHTYGEIRSGNGTLIIEGNYYLENNEENVDDTELLVYYEEGNGYIHIYGDAVFKDGFFYEEYYGERYCFLIEGNLRICGTRISQYGGSGSFLLAGTKKQMVYCEDWGLGESRFLIDNHSDEGVFFANILEYTSVNENGCKVVYISENATYGWKLEEDMVWSGDLVLNGGTLDLNGYNLTITGNFIQMGGRLKVNKGTLCVEGDYRTQIPKEQEDGSVLYERGAGSIELTSDEERIVVFGDMVLDTRHPFVGEPRGILEVRGNCDVQCTGVWEEDSAADFGRIVFEFSGEAEQSFVWGLRYENIYGLINRNKKSLSISGSPYITGRIADETGTVGSASVIQFSESTFFENGRWSGSIGPNENGISLNQDLEIGGRLRETNWLELNGNTVKAKSAYVNGVKLQKGKLIIEEDITISGPLIMENPEDYVFCGGDFIIKTDGEGMQNGTIEIQGDFVQTYIRDTIWGKEYHGKIDINSTVVFSGEEEQKIEIVLGTLTVKELTNRSTGGLRLERIRFGGSVYITGKCIDETGTVCGDGYININNINQIESDVWGGNVQIIEEIDMQHDLRLGGLTIFSGGKLNGHFLDVGDLSFHGCLYTGGGEIVCSGNLEVHGKLITESDSEVVYVGSEFCIRGTDSYETQTAGGIIDVKGDVNTYGSLNDNFKEFTLVLSGTERQSICNSMRVGGFVNRNTEGVSINCELYVVEECFDDTGTVWKTNASKDAKGVCLGEATSIQGEKWNGDIIVTEDKVLEQDLVIAGRLVVKQGVSLDVADHTVTAAACEVDGGLYLGTGEVLCEGNLTLGTEGKLIPREPESRILVTGDLEINSVYDYSGEAIQGSIELKGDILSEEIAERVILGDITLILSGDERQIIHKRMDVANLVNRNTCESSYSNGAVTVTEQLIDETGTATSEIVITDTTTVINNSWSGSLLVKSPLCLKQDLYVDGGVRIEEGSVVQLNGKELRSASVSVGNGVLNIGDGTLNCNNLYVYEQGTLIMQDARGYVTVEKLCRVVSEINHTGYLTAGVMEIRGELSQRSENTFFASEEHTVILNAENGKVNVYLQYPDTFRFNNVVLNNAKKYYTINTDLEAVSNHIIVDYEVPVSSLEAGEITYTTTEFAYEVPEDAVVTEYVIFRDGEEIANTTETTFVDKDLKPGTEYVYEVYPRNDWGALAQNSPKLEIATKTDTEPPVLQGNFRVTLRTGSSITLSWNPATDNVGVEGYAVYRDGVEIATGLTDTVYKDTTAEEKKAYQYSIVAYDGSGNVSLESNKVESSLVKPEITALYPEPGKNIKAETLKLSVHFRNYGNSTGNQVRIEYKNSLGEWEDLSPQLLTQNWYNSTTLYVQYEWDVSHVDGVKGYALRYTLYDADGNTDVEQVTYFVDHQSPEAPKNVKGITDNGIIKINWEPSVSEDCTEYRIYRKRTEEATFSLLADVKGQMNTSYNDKKVEAEEEYVYVVTAADAYAYESEYSESVNVKADRDALPPVVEEVLPKAGSVNRLIGISAKASDNKELDSLLFLFRKEEETEWTELGTVAAKSGKAEYTLDTTQYEDGVYFIGVEAIDAAGNRSEEIFTRRYQIDNTGIGKIKIAEYIKSSTQIQIKWEDVTEADLAYFQVEQLQGKTFVAVGTVSDVLGYTVNNLSPNVTYSFRVVGYDTLGNRGEPSDVCEITTEKDTIKPSILGVYPVASYYKDNIPLQVNARDNYALGKAVFSYSLNGVDYVELAEVAASGEKQTNLYYNLSLGDFPEGSIFIKFEVYDSAGNKNALLENGEDVVVEYVIDRAAPSKVENLATNTTEGCVELRWNSNVEQDVKYYRIYRADGENGGYYLHKNECNTKNYYDTSVRAGACYRYKVSAVDIAGNEGECSEEIVAIVTADTQAPTVTGVTPYNGETVGGQVQIKALALDNASLTWVKVEYRKDGENEWILAATQYATGKSFMANVWWNTETLPEGRYQLRITACDAAGNVSAEQLVIYEVDHTAPEVPQLSAESGHFEIKLTIDGEKSSDFAYYEIYRRVVGSGSYTKIATVTEDRYVDTTVIPGDIYFYQVAVYDKCGNMAKTEAVECYADDLDVVAPVAVLPENLVGLTGMEIAFDGMGCTDNVRVTQYLWNMGDGTELEGPQPVYSYQEAGDYTVLLSVKDAAGNEAQAATTVTVKEKTGRGSSLVKVVDENGNAIPYASVFVSTPVTEGYTLKADSRGLVNVVADNGTYNVAAYATGYLPEDIDIAVSEYEVHEYTLTLVKDELIVGELTVHRMELEEMLEAGVDFSDPENYNLFVFNVTLTFAQSPYPVEIKYVSGSGGTSYNFTYESEEQGSSGERTVYIQEIAQTTETEEEEEVPILAYVSTTQHVSWLKDMYEVELGILNAADSRYTIEDSVATLNLPESGVSLAKLVGGQSLTQEMGTIRGQERKTVSWVVKGDKSGKYTLTADFEGTLMPFRKKVTARFETENEFEVTTGEGIHIYVMPEKTAYIGEQYYIQFKIVNESEKVGGRNRHCLQKRRCTDQCRLHCQNHGGVDCLRGA